MRASPGETESSSAEVQLDKGYPGRRWANGAAGRRRTRVRRGLILKCSLDTGAMPQKKIHLGFGARFRRISRFCVQRNSCESHYLQIPALKRGIDKHSCVNERLHRDRYE